MALLPPHLRIYPKRAVRSKAVYTSTQVPFELKRYFFDRYLGVRYTSAVPRVARSVKTKLTSGMYLQNLSANKFAVSNKLDVYVLMDSKFSVLVIPITFESPLKNF